MGFKRKKEEREKIKNYLLSENIDYKRNKSICNELKSNFNIEINEKQIIAYKHQLGLKSKFKIGYIKRICQNCGKEFYILNHKLKYEKHYYCSYKCSGEARSKKALKKNLKDCSELEIKRFLKKWCTFIKKEIHNYNKSFLDSDMLYGLIIYYIPSIIANTKRQNITGDWLKAYIRATIKHKIWRELDFYKRTSFLGKREELKYGL